jgi:CheY-like chemotaxis protein/AraC-like DNA-binding protein
MPGDSPVPPDQVVVPETFVDQVKDALEHLYDFPYLQRHPLTHTRAAPLQGPAASVAQSLRRELMDAVETLNPGPDVPFRAPHARLYNLLHLRYVEGMTVQEVANELGISARQTYRDFRRAEESVAVVLWNRRQESSPQARQPRAARLSSIQAEMARLEIRPRPIDARALLEHAQKAVESLAARHSVSLLVDSPPESVIVSADPVVAHQVLVNILSHAVKQSQPGTLRLAMQADQAGAAVFLHYTVKTQTNELATVNPVVTQLTERMGWKVEQEDQPVSQRILTLHITSHGPTVLVVDDNEGLVELLGRYLTDHTCRVTAALSGQEGLRLAYELVPDAIILDVMMPGMDGWEFLQRLRARPETADIPIIICSVFNDPELAYSLGASLYLPKPVSRDEILSALRQLGVV